MDLPPVPWESSDGCRQVWSGKEGGTYVAAGEVTTLEHELGDDAVERRALVAEALLTSAESTEVLGGLGDNIVEEVEGDAAVLDC